MSITMKEMMNKSRESLIEMKNYALKGAWTKKAYEISLVLDFAHKRVRVVKGRKVKLGTEGVVFWMGAYDNSKYGDLWGIYTTYRVGIKDDDGNIYWTSVDNIEVVK